MTDDPLFPLSLLLPFVCGGLLWLNARRMERKAAQFRQILLRDLLAVSVCLSLVFAAFELFWHLTENLLLVSFLVLPVLAGFAAMLFFHHNRHCVSPPGWLRLIFGNCLLLLLLLAAALPVFEVYYRFICDTTDSISSTKVSQRWMQRHFRFNQEGFRDNIEYLPDIQKGRRRVSFVGDSFTAGHGIKDPERRFANLIRQRNPEWEIHVLAHLGDDTGAELQTLTNYFNKNFEPDLVVLVYCLNDISDIMPEWTQSLDNLANRISHRPRIFNESYFLDMLYHRFIVAQTPWIRNYYGLVKDAYQGGKWQKQKRRLNTLQTLVETHGGHLSVVTFPFLHAIGPHYEYQPIHVQLGEFWKEQGVPHLDLLTAFKGLSPQKITVNRFDAHPNEFASAIAAEQIEIFLAQQMATNARPTFAPPGNNGTH